ncbi:MAG: energy transducer TonB, partial [Gammaproteobacteria bacterium]
QEEWRRFLEKYTQPIVQEVGKNAQAGKYTVNVRFIVEKDGSISNVSILNDPGYGIGRKVLGMMKYVPKWKPAIQNEKVVRSYHTQPITFVIADT